MDRNYFNKKEKDNGDTPVLLCSIPDDRVSVGMIIAALKEQGIPAMKKTRGAGQYLSILMGFSIEDVEIYVPSSLHDKAQEILTVIMGTDDLDELDNFES